MSANGTPRAVVEYRRMLLEERGLDPELSKGMASKFRGDIRREVDELAEKHNATPPEPAEDDTDDPGALAKRHGRRFR